MERGGWLRREERLVDGKIRKYYRATRAGKRALAQAKPRIRELVNEVLEG
jgi:DNA-binding PadR family transcriptional regulator